VRASYAGLFRKRLFSPRGYIATLPRLAYRDTRTCGLVRPDELTEVPRKIRMSEDIAVG